MLAVMIGFLCYRAYQILQPPPEDDDAPFVIRRPSADLSPDAPRPSIPPRAPSVPGQENWASLWTRLPFIYVRGGVRNTKDVGEDYVIELTVHMVRDVGGGRFKAQIETKSSKKWYAEGQAFESFELLSIDGEEECCEIFAESLGKTLTRCAE